MKRKTKPYTGNLTAAHVNSVIDAVIKANKGNKVRKSFVLHLPKDFHKLKFVKSNGFSFADKTLKNGKL